MGINAVKFGTLAVASAAAGGLVGVRTGQKIARETFDEFRLNYQPKQEKKRHPLRKLLGLAALTAAAVVLAKTPQGKKAIAKAKEFVKPYLEKFKATNVGKKVAEYFGKGKKYATEVADKVKNSNVAKKAAEVVDTKVKPAVEKAKAYVKNLFKVDIKIDNV